MFTTAYTWAKSIDTKSAAAGIGNDVAGWQGFLDNHDVRRDRGDPNLTWITGCVAVSLPSPGRTG